MTQNNNFHTLFSSCSVNFGCKYELEISNVDSHGWDITPCSPLNVNRRFGEHIASIFMVEYKLATRFYAGFWLSLLFITTGVRT
jgi:hypothetical protein